MFHMLIFRSNNYFFSVFVFFIDAGLYIAVNAIKKNAGQHINRYRYLQEIPRWLDLA